MFRAVQTRGEGKVAGTGCSWALWHGKPVRFLAPCAMHGGGAATLEALVRPSSVTLVKSKVIKGLMELNKGELFHSAYFCTKLLFRWQQELKSTALSI